MIIGTCHLCGTYGELTDEHIPPKSAFNNQNVLEKNIFSFIESGNWNHRGKRFKQLILPVLCGICNSWTSTYDKTYVDVAKQCLYLLPLVNHGYEGNIILKNIYPLRLIKEIIKFMIVSNGLEFRYKHPDLVNFVLNRDVKGLPNKYKIHFNLADGNTAKLTGVSGIRSNVGIDIISCVDFRPISVILSFDKNFDGMHDISHFANFGYKEMRQDIRLYVRKGYIYSPYPGVYNKPI